MAICVRNILEYYCSVYLFLRQNSLSVLVTVEYTLRSELRAWKIMSVISVGVPVTISSVIVLMFINPDLKKLFCNQITRANC